MSINTKSTKKLAESGNLVKPVLSEVLISNNWISVNDEMPKKYKIVLLFMPFCRHKFETGFFNGLYWLTIDGVKIKNMLYWADFKDENQPEFEQDEYGKSLKSINYNFANENKRVAIVFLKWINKQVDFKYIPSDDLYINIETGEKITTEKIFDVFLKIAGHTINLA
jgi:hypothetical protein